MTRTDKKVSNVQKDTATCLSPGGASDEVESAMKILEGRWKMIIIFQLYAQPIMRFSELERAIATVSQKMLIQQLRELERDGVVQRTVHAQVPPKVEYSLTELGQALRPALSQLRRWAALRRGAAP
jgi:DNA-binding HxlR family transcriptional regulator